MALIQNNTSYNRSFLMISTNNYITGATGISVTVNLAKAGAAFGPSVGTVTEIGNGVYYVSLTATDTNTLGDLMYFCTGTNAAPTNFADQIIGVNLNALNVTSGTTVNIVNPVIVAGGTVNISTQQLYVKKNSALSGFMFLMVSSTDHVTPKTGLSITSQVSINGGAFGATTNSATEISNGIYTINLTAADTNGSTLMFLFTGSGADNRYIEVITQS